MSIKSELKAKLQKVREMQTEEERKLEIEARKMIEEFLIPKFRKITEIHPTSSLLRIEFHVFMFLGTPTKNSLTL